MSGKRFGEAAKSECKWANKRHEVDEKRNPKERKRWPVRFLQQEEAGPKIFNPDLVGGAFQRERERKKNQES